MTESGTTPEATDEQMRDLATRTGAVLAVRAAGPSWEISVLTAPDPAWRVVTSHTDFAAEVQVETEARAAADPGSYLASLGPVETDNDQWDTWADRATERAAYIVTLDDRQYAAT